MAWYTIPKIKIEYVQDEKGKDAGVLLSTKDFEKLVEKMEDFLDNKAVEKIKEKKNPKFYSHADIKQLIKDKSR